MEQPVPRLSGLLETSLYVEDLVASRAFYERLFGFEPYLADTRMVALGVPGGGVLLLFRRGASTAPSETPFGTIPGHDGTGHLHLAFAIPRGELAAWEAHLAAQGIEVESRVTWQRGGTSLYFRDPDGHVVEVATPGLWPNF
jgi:catechol 2,3-dioxygenase-like lactoylglutathione lyase family enzyme